MTIYVGIGGWTFAPWRGTFYPKDLVQKQELAFASRQVNTIEINGTFYGTQKPASFAHWHDETPDDFIFAVKAPRYATHRRELATAGESIERFFDSGLSRLGAKLGPINWQLPTTKQFNAEDLEGFLQLLPRTLGGKTLRHAVELRHASFAVAPCMALLSKYGVAVVAADSAKYPSMFDVTAPFVYVRLQAAEESKKSGYAPKILDAWSARATTWAAGGFPEDLPRLVEASPKQKAKAQPTRDVFIYVINGFKPKAPSAAMALLSRV